MQQDIRSQASWDERVVAITGDVFMQNTAPDDVYRQNKVVILQVSGAISEHTGDEYAYGVNELKLSPSGKFYAYALGGSIIVFSSANHKQVFNVVAPEYDKYLVKTQYGIHYKADDQVALSDGNGFVFNLNLK